MATILLMLRVYPQVYLPLCSTLFADRGDDCAGTLFTLKPGSSPEQTLKQLFGAQNSIGPLNEGAPRPYIAMEDVLQTGSQDRGPESQEGINRPRVRPNSGHNSGWVPDTPETRFTNEGNSVW
jgi:hypothetical protein